jgi:glyoxylase-like metal-dependent hydrolase (beta-lactamase superfamily II)
VREWVTPDEEIGPQLRSLGFAADDVRWVVLTHLHTDHAGGLGHFPRSEILVSRPEFENAKGTMGKLRGFLPHRWPSWFAPRLIELANEPYGPFPSSLRLTHAGDVTIVDTHGHTPGHVSVVLNDGEESIFLAGDTSYTEALMLAGVVDGVTGDRDAARQTVERIQAYAAERPTVYLPSHDPESGRRLDTRTVVHIR